MEREVLVRQRLVGQVLELKVLVRERLGLIGASSFNVAGCSRNSTAPANLTSPAHAGPNEDDEVTDRVMITATRRSALELS
jgi:hypothetical protein